MIRNWLRNFMIGRYGPDQLNMTLLVSAMVCTLVYGITGLVPLMVLYYFLLIYMLFRFLSRNISQRRLENDRFLVITQPVRRWFRTQVKKNASRKTHRFFRCPSCRNTLRVPKGKGKIQITCPKCGLRFTKKT